METVRQEIKFNFLKNIIMRLDFQGVLPAELEKVIIKAKAILKEAGFNRFSERIDNAVNLNRNFYKLGITFTCEMVFKAA